MEGKLVAGGGLKAPNAAPPAAVKIARDPVDLPDPLSSRPRRTVDVELEAVELVGKLAPETTYAYWTFNGKVPGPFIRIRVGDTVALPFKKRKTSRMIHSGDLHAVTGQGAARSRRRRPSARPRRSALRRATAAFTCIIAPLRWSPTASPVAGAG